MDNPENPSKWDDLARALGAEAPPEPANDPKPTNVQESKPAESRRKAEPPPRPKPKPPSWENLAADLGLEVPPPPPAPPAPATPTHTPVESQPPREEVSKRRDDRPPRSEGSSRRERPPRREDSPRREEASESEDRLARPPRREEAAGSEDRPARPPRREGSSQSGNRPPRREREQPPRQRRDEPRRPQRDDAPRGGREDSPRRERAEPSQPNRDESLRDDELREEISLPPSAPEPEIEAKPSQSLGVSLWHKIFGSPDQQAERIADSTNDDESERFVEGPQAREDRPREDRHGRGGRRNQESASNRDSESVEEVSESWERESVEVEFTESGNADDRAGQTMDENGEPRKRRRRRGRGRGRGRRPDGEHSGETRSAEQADQGDQGDDAAREPDDDTVAREPRESRGPREQREPRSRGGRSSRPRREPPRRHADPKDDLDDGLEEIILDDDNDTDEMDLNIDGEEAGDSDGRDTPAGHKSIPSWDEAIGMIVDTNLATRTDRRHSSPSQSRGSNGARGRSRGGRRRKKS